MPRFIILEHSGAPDDPAGIHYDLLLEDGSACRTWRLAALPEPGGSAVAATELPPHRLAWLDHDAGEVSGGRGFARRIDAGTYACTAPDASGATMLKLILLGTATEQLLLLCGGPDRWRVSLHLQK